MSLTSPDDEGPCCTIPPTMRYRTLRFYQSEILTQCQYALSAYSGMVQTLTGMDALNQEAAAEGLLGPPPLPHHEPEAWKRYQERREALMQASNRRMVQQHVFHEQLFRFGQDFLVACGNVSKFFFPIGIHGRQTRRRDPLEAQRIVRRRDRRRILRQVYGVPEDSPLSDDRDNIRKLRDSIEHYDERIDTWAELNVRVTTVRSIALTAPGQGDFFNIHPHLDAISFFGQYYELSPVIRALQIIQQKSRGEAGLLLGWRIEPDRVSSELKGLWVERARFDKDLSFSRHGVQWSEASGFERAPIPLPGEFYVDETVELRGKRCVLDHPLIERDCGNWCDDCRIWYSNLALQS